MLSYFRYVELNLIKKKSVWVGAGLFWLYIGLLLLIVPAILHMGPFFIWSNTLFDLQSYLIIIFAIICGITAVVIFNDPKDDGSELIIISKPNNRWKIIIIKFVCFLVHNLVVLTVGMLLMLFTLCFGRISISNPNGVDFAKLPGIEWATLLGSLIIIFIFGSIAILISILSGKIAILVGTIGFAIVINVLYLVAPAISKSQAQYLSNNYDIKLNSYRYLSVGNEVYNAVNASYVTDQNGTLYYTNEAAKHSTNSIVSYANIAQQMTSIYKINEYDAKQVELNGAYGSNVNYRYSITNQTTPVLQQTNNRPLLILKKGTTESAPRIDYVIPSVELSNLQFFSMAGATANSMFYIWHNTSILEQASSSRFFDVTDLVKYNDETYVKTFMKDHVLIKFGADVPWNSNNESYDKFHLQIGEWLTQDDSSLANALGLPISTGDSFTNAYNMTIDSFKIYLLILNEYSEKMYQSFDTQSLDINNSTVLHNWYEGTSSAKATNIANRWNEYFAKGNDHWAYDPSNTTNNYNWVDTDPTKSWIVTLTYSTLSSLNDQATDNGNIANQIFMYKATPFYTSESVLIFWTTFSLLLFAISILVYAKTDIK